MVDGVTEEETRAYLQERLAVLSKVLFWGLGGVLLFSGALIYELFPELRPALATHILIGGTAGIAIIGFTWRCVLENHTLSVHSLHAIDLFYAVGSGIGIGASAFFAPELRATAYTALVLSLFVVITRAIIVPSTPTRTALVSAMTFAPIVAAALGLALRTEQDVPGPVYVGGAFVLCSVGGLLAATGSGVMYGLRNEAEVVTRLGQYTLDRRIGKGGMGVVYRAHHALLRRPTAIKLLALDRVGVDTLSRFEREVQYTSELTHPNTVAVFDYGRSSDGTFYYAMEYLDGVDLEQLVRNYGPQPPGRIVYLLAQVCGALQEAHDRKIIHRDIKPANIIVCRRGGNPDVAKVVDFGLVKEISSDSAATSQTVLGTPAYLAPEAITSPTQVGPASDLYALGAVAYFMLSGRRVFDGATDIDTCLKHVTGTPPPIDGPPKLVDVIMRCLAKDPAQRYGSATALAEALRFADPGDWDEDRGHRWWSEHDVRREVVLSEQKTHTIQIQLEGRS